MLGKVVAVNSTRGFGFIRPTDRSGADVFFHHKVVGGGLVFGPGLKGERVTFATTTDDLGRPRATRVEPATAEATR